MYATRPLSTPVFVSSDESTDLAMPKSSTFACPSNVTNTLSGLTSRWTMPSGWPSKSRELVGVVQPEERLGDDAQVRADREAALVPRCGGSIRWSDRPSRNSMTM